MSFCKSSGFRFVVLAGCLAASMATVHAQPQLRRINKGAAFEPPSAPVPADPHELVTSGIQIASTPADRLAALNLLRAAADNAVSHRPKMEPFDFQAQFTATGNLSYTGTGELGEIWMSGQSWRVTESLGNYSLARIGYSGQTVDQTPVTMIPMRAQMLRNEIMWSTAVNDAGVRQIRTAAAQWNGKPVTCILLSNVPGSTAQSRLWEESEYCIDNDSKALAIHSVVPGTYAVFGYSKNLQFHSKQMPDHITIFVNGNQAVDSSFGIADPQPGDQALLAVAPGAPLGRPSVPLNDAAVITLNVAGSSGNTTEPVMLHLQLGPQGAILESEVSAASNPSLIQKALDTIKTTPMGAFGSHLYVNVRFVPGEQ